MIMTEKGMLPALQRAVPHHYTPSHYRAVTLGNVSIIFAAPGTNVFVEAIIVISELLLLKLSSLLLDIGNFIG